MTHTLSLSLAGVLAVCTALSAADPVPALIKDLQSGELPTRIQAAESLGELGGKAGPAVEALIAALDSQDTALMHEVTLTLGRIGPPAAPAVAALQGLLKKSQAPFVVRASAIDALRLIGPAAKPALPQIKRQFEINVRRIVSLAAARAVVTLAPEDEELQSLALTELLKGLTAQLGSSRDDAVQGLAEMGAPALPELIKIVENGGNGTVRACDTLAAMGPVAQPAVPAILALLGNKKNQRDHALRALGAIGGHNDTVIPAVTAALHDELTRVRVHAAETLGLYGPAAASAVPALIKTLGDSQQVVRREAATALGLIGPAAREAVPALAKALDDESGSVTINAAEALGQIGAPAVPVLIERLEIPSMRALAAGVLGDMGAAAKDAVPALTKALQSDQTEARTELVLALGAIGPEARSAIPELVKTLQANQDSARAAAAYALASLEAREAIPALVQSAAVKDDSVLALACAVALVRLSPRNAEHARAALPPLMESLKLEDRDVRLTTLDALAAMGAESKLAVEPLAGLCADADPEVRASAAYALGSIGPEAKTAAFSLEKLLAGEQEYDVYERTIAAWALVRIGASPDVVKSAVPLFVQAVADKELDLRVEAAEALGQAGVDTPKVRKALRAAMQDSDPALRQAAEAALKKLRS